MIGSPNHRNAPSVDPMSDLGACLRSIWPCPHWALIEAEANLKCCEHETFPRSVPWARAACAASAPAFTICPLGSRVSWRPGWPASAREPKRSPRSIGGPRRSSPVRERSRGARAPERRSARAAVAALPRLRADLFGRDGLAAGRASPPGGVPRGGALHDLRSTRPCRPLAERLGVDKTTVRRWRMRVLAALGRAAEPLAGMVEADRPPAANPARARASGSGMRAIRSCSRSRRDRPGASGVGAACPCRRVPADGGCRRRRWPTASAPGGPAG